MIGTDIDVRLVGVAKTYGDSTVLTDVDLEVGHGEFVALLGRSVTGKSTLLNRIGGSDAANQACGPLLGGR